MSELKRLRESGDPEWRELLHYTKARATPSTQRIDALAARVVAGLAAGAPGASGMATAQARHPAWVWLLGAALVVLIGFGALHLRQDPPRASKPLVATAPAPAPAAQPTPEPAVIELAPASAAPRVQERPARKATDAARPAMQTKRTNPTAEIVLLKNARRALRGHPQAALELVEQHRREHPAGIFAEEREALAVEALWRAGERDSAAQRLRAMLSSFPRSTYRERLTALLAEAPSR